MRIMESRRGGFAKLSEVVEEDRPAVGLLDGGDVLDGDGELINHFPEVDVDLVRGFAELCQELHELRVEMHDGFQVNLPQFLCDLVVETNVLVADEVKLVELDVHLIIEVLVVLELLLQPLHLLEQVIGIGYAE